MMKAGAALTEEFADFDEELFDLQTLSRRILTQLAPPLRHQELVQQLIECLQQTAVEDPKIAQIFRLNLH